MMPAELKAAVEDHLGVGEIPQEIFDEAAAQGYMKLNRINARYGTNHGDDYLVELIWEAVVALVAAFRYHGKGAI